MESNDVEEIFDEVNERDEVIGQRPRSEIHHLKLRHRAVHLLVFNDTGSLFLQKRSLLKDCFPGKWDSSASGHLDQGEDYDACAVREVREEIGLVLAVVPEKLFKINACPETGQEFVWVYRCHANGPFQLQEEEISEGRWLSPGEVAHWIADCPEDFANGFILVWRRYQAHLAAKP
ncbi:MAG: putative Nudix hydrolase YfcD [Verrucomicrobia subdivision 3 bacterium]|nr:putative Nudix hydrolase YfcD [Limisphaerales bacterium]MCS1412365.1 putative Nudix hydrolase YfcD [Limisphaerales bacterium]